MKTILKRLAAFFFALTVGVVIYSTIFLFQTDSRKISDSIKVNIPRTLAVEIFKPNCVPISTWKPNPFILILEVDENRNLKLNHEDFGKIKNTSLLENRLADVFHDREANGIFKKGSAKIETTLIVKFAPSIEYEGVFNLIQVLQKVGANPVLLDTDTDYKLNLRCPELYMDAYSGGGSGGGYEIRESNCRFIQKHF